MENLYPTLLSEMVRRGFILDSVQNCSCVRAILFRNTVSVGLKLIPRLTASWLAQLGERRCVGGGGVLKSAREVGDKGRQAAACRILALSFYEVGDYIQSIESSKEELAIAREEGNRKRSISVRCSGQVLSARRRIQTEYWVRQKSTEHCQVWDHFTFLGNCPPTPPLNQHQHSVLT